MFQAGEGPRDHLRHLRRLPRHQPPAHHRRRLGPGPQRPGVPDQRVRRRAPGRGGYPPARGRLLPAEPGLRRPHREHLGADQPPPSGVRRAVLEGWGGAPGAGRPVPGGHRPHHPLPAPPAARARPGAQPGPAPGAPDRPAGQPGAPRHRDGDVRPATPGPARPAARTLTCMTEAPLTPRAGQTRAAIVEAALRMFRETGYEATTMRAIAREAGVSTGNAYYYFSSKEELIREFYARNQAEHEAACRPVLAAETGFAPRLRGTVRALIDVLSP